MEDFIVFSGTRATLRYKRKDALDKKEHNLTICVWDWCIIEIFAQYKIGPETLGCGQKVG
jgi:hypothetical protein